MAISYDATTSYSNASASSVTFSHTVAIDADFLVVCASVQGTVTITGVTYNGVAMTNAGVDLLDDRMTIWYLSNPATGVNNVIVSYSGADVGDGFAMSLKGTDTSSPLGATGSNDSVSTVTSQSIAVTTTVADSWLLDFAWINDATITSLAVDGSQSLRASQEANGIEEGTSTLVTTTTGSYSMGWSWTTAARILQGVIEVKPASTPSTFIPKIIMS